MLCPAAQAQQPFTRGYIFIAPTPTVGPDFSGSAPFGILPAPTSAATVPTGNNWYSAGGGVEHVFGNHLGAGLDLAAILPGQGKVFPNTIGVVSPTLYAHLSSNAKTDVFALGGYSLLVRDFTANAVNVGIGVNYWFHENTGLMVSSRAVIVPDYTWPKPPKQYYVEIRFGLTFR